MIRTYRLNVAAIIIRFSKKGKLKVLVGRRREYPQCWQWPQGGVDKGETLEHALLREVQEETGLTQYKILHAMPDPIRYDFNEKNRRKFKAFLGQEQYYFILSIDPRDPGLKKLPKVSNSEFTELRWKSPKTVVETAPPFKLEAYKTARNELLKFVKENIYIDLPGHPVLLPPHRYQNPVKLD